MHAPDRLTVVTNPYCDLERYGLNIAMPEPRRVAAGLISLLDGPR